MSTRCYRDETHDKPLSFHLPGHGQHAVGCHAVGQVYDVGSLHHLFLIIIGCRLAVNEVRHQAGLRLPIVHTGTGRDDHIVYRHRAVGEHDAEIASACGGKGDGLLLHAAQVLIAGAQLADGAIVRAVVRDLQQADVGQFAVATAKKVPLRRFALCHLCSGGKGRHLHRRCTGLALCLGLVTDAAGGERPSEVEHQRRVAPPCRHDIQQARGAKQFFPIR